MTRTRTVLLLTVLLSVWLVPIVQAQQATRPAASQTQPALTPEQWMARAEEAVASNDFVAAANAFQKVVAAEPNNLNAGLGLADSLVKIGDLVRAKDIYESCRKLNPNDWRVQFGLGSMYLQRDYFKLAKPYLERAVVLAPSQSRARVLVNLALTFRGLHQTSDAMEKIRQALALDPGNMDARRILIGLHLEAKQLDDALAENRVALDLVRGNLAARPDDRQMVEHMLQTLSQEVGLLQSKLATQPDDVAIRLRLVEAMQQQSFADQQLVYHYGLEILRPVLQKLPDNIDLLLAHARLLYLVGRLGPAADDLHKVLAVAPDNVLARQLLAKIEALAQTTQPAQ